MYGHVLNMRNSIFCFNLGIQFRTVYQNQAKSSLELGQVSGGPAAHPHQNFCSVAPLPPWSSGWLLIRGWHLQYVWFQEHLFD